MALWAMELQFGVFEFLPTTRGNKRKQNASMISAYCAAFHTCLFSCSDRSTWAPDESRFFFLYVRKTRIPPIWAPCRNKDDAGSGISGVYLWQSLCCRQLTTVITTISVQSLCSQSTVPSKWLMKEEFCCLHIVGVCVCIRSVWLGLLMSLIERLVKYVLTLPPTWNRTHCSWHCTSFMYSSLCTLKPSLPQCNYTHF